jgi:hypothetical protein
MSEHLDVEIEDLETRVMNVKLWPLEEKEGVVVHPF